MLKPNMSGNSLKSFLSKVDLPVPEGPQMTTGRRAAAARLRPAEMSQAEQREVWVRRRRELFM